MMRAYALLGVAPWTARTLAEDRINGDFPAQHKLGRRVSGAFGVTGNWTNRDRRSSFPRTVGRFEAKKKLSERFCTFSVRRRRLQPTAAEGSRPHLVRRSQPQAVI